VHILLIGPDHDQGSIPPYLAVLTHALRELGTTVDRLGSSGVPYDIDARRFRTAEDIVHAAGQLLDTVELASYDVISLHVGNLEIEQLLPVLWAKRPHPPVAHHVHTLAPTLFTDHVPDQRLHRAVLEGLGSVDGLVHFGHHAATTLTHAPAVTSVISWLPTTIPPGTAPTLTPALRRALTLPDGVPLVSLYGYAAPWKDPALLLTAAGRLDRSLRIVLAGPGWDDTARAGVQLRSIRLGRNGCVEFIVVPEYLDAGHRCALAVATDVAVFPYQPHPSFQGSGAVADYLAHGVPVLATDVATMSELISDGGALVPPRDPRALADGLRRLTADTVTSKHAHATAARRAEWFTAEHHAMTCLALYEQVIAHAGTGARR
jgi:glycosyltransferase involved in cell wall biosynthesis